MNSLFKQPLQQRGNNTGQLILALCVLLQLQWGKWSGGVFKWHTTRDWLPHNKTTPATMIHLCLQGHNSIIEAIWNTEGAWLKAMPVFFRGLLQIIHRTALRNTMVT